MATEQQTRPAPSAKFEAYVEQQLANVKRRLRAIDLGAAALLLLAITFGYAAVMAIFDLIVRDSGAWWVGNVRLIAFGVYVLAMSGGSYLLVTRFLRRINPYYCAHQLEQTLPDAKNSVINWLDLRDEHLPPAIRQSLGSRAAQDLKEADADLVADPKTTWRMGSIAGGLFVVLVILFALSPQQFGSLIARAFLPLGEIRLANRATITLIKPTGDVEVPHHQRVEFLAEISGRFPKVNHPQAPTLWYRYAPGDPFQPTPLTEDGNGQWSSTMAADQVQNGFWYKISAADAETPVYQVTTRSLPEAKRFEVTYRYRPYRKLKDENVEFPNDFALFPDLRGHRGTEIAMVVRTNQPVRDGWLQLEFDNQQKTVPGERLADDPKAFRCKFTLERTCQYRVIFKTKAEELNNDRSAYRIDVLDDTAPAVVITKPGEDVTLPANGTLTIEGQAQDDFGIKGLALHLRVLEGETKPNLAAQPYRPGKKFQFETGAYPTKFDYLDVLALDQIKTEQGQVLPLSPNMVLEYWLEATDNSDYPSAAGNVGRSLAYKIKIDPPKDQKKEKEQRKQAQDQKQKHDKQQDQQHQKENKEKKDEQARNNAGKSADQQRAEDQQKDLEQRAKDLKDKLEQQEKKEDQGTGKGGDPDKAETKSSDGQQPQASQKDSNAGKEPQKAGDNKSDGGSKNDGPKSAEAKGPGDQKPPNQPDQKQASEPKGPGNEKPQAGAKGSDGNDKPGAQPEPQPANAKAGPKDDPKQQPSEGKDKGPQGNMGQSAQAKDNGPKDDDKMNQGGQAKAADGKKDAPQPQAKKTDKQDPKNQPGQKGDSKSGGGEQLTKEKGPGNAKPDATASKEPPGADGSRKPATAKPNDEPTRKAEAKPGEAGGGAEKQQGPPAQAKNQPMNPNLKNPNPEPQGSAKQTPTDQTKQSAHAKDEKGQGPPREPTLKDLERLKDELAKGDSKALKTAEELKRNLPESKDPEMSKAAEELLQGAQKQLDAMAQKEDPKANPNAAGGNNEKPMGQANDPMTAQGGNEKPPMTPQDNNSKKNQPGDDNNKANARGGSGPDGQNAPENLKPAEANKEFANRVSNLQLEDLKSRASPEKRKLANITDEEWQQFLQSAANYEKSLQKLSSQPKSGPSQMRANSSQLQSSGPRHVKTQPGGNNPASVGQGIPPLELRQAHDLFTKQK